MNRKPETKTAAQLITAAFASQGVKFGHQAALNLLATLEGFESFAQMKAAQVASKQAAPVKEVEFFTAHLLFGEDEGRAFREVDGSAALTEALEPAKSFTYPTPELLNAFLDGVEEAVGWFEYTNVTSLVQTHDSALEAGLQGPERESRLVALRNSLEMHSLPYNEIMDEIEAQ